MKRLFKIIAVIAVWAFIFIELGIVNACAFLAVIAIICWINSR